MTIKLNGDEKTLRGASLTALLAEQGISSTVATAVNEQFVPASKRGDVMLKPGDRVEALAPMQGG